MGMLAVHDASVEMCDTLLGYDRTVFLPTRAVSLRQLQEALYKVIANDSLCKLGEIKYEEDKGLSAVLESFPTRVDSKRAEALGAPPVPEIEDMIVEYMQDFDSAVADGVMLNAQQVKNATVEAAEDMLRIVALITGAGSGIGRAVAVRLSHGGWGGPTGRGTAENGQALKVSLVLAGRRSAPLQETKAMCEKAARELGVEIDALVVPTDVIKENEVQHLMNAIKSSFHRLDLLFNNAGINMPPTSVEQIESLDFTRIIDTNLTACWRMAKVSMQLMSTQQPQGGRIINNGSISAYSPRPGSAPYTASKHAVLGLTKSIALDGRPMNITCGQIDFGNVVSDLTKSMSTGMPQANGQMMPEPTFLVEDAANTVHAMAALPLSANVLNMTVMASGMPFVGRG
jgi:NAD(P)-dependent dehydrogenase (short-subunit alcohol dehydrogenase family)